MKDFASTYTVEFGKTKYFLIKDLKLQRALMRRFQENAHKQFPYANRIKFLPGVYMINTSKPVDTPPEEWEDTDIVSVSSQIRIFGDIADPKDTPEATEDCSNIDTEPIV